MAAAFSETKSLHSFVFPWLDEAHSEILPTLSYVMLNKIRRNILLLFITYSTWAWFPERLRRWSNKPDVVWFNSRHH